MEDLNTDIRLAAIPSAMPVIERRVRQPYRTIPSSIGIVTNDDSDKSIDALAKSLKIVAAGGLERVEVIPPDPKSTEEFDGLIFLDHNILDGIVGPSTNKPLWLWIAETSTVTTIRLREAATTTYQRIFHAGSWTSEQCAFDHLPCSIGDPKLFQPQHRIAPVCSVSIVQDMSSCIEIVPAILNMIQDSLRVNVIGEGWRAAGIPARPATLETIQEAMIRSLVYLDHATDRQVQEGMVSPRLYQALACEIPVITNQKPEHVPTGMRRHIHFVERREDLYHATKRLLSDVVARARLKANSRKSVLKETSLERARVIWSRMVADRLIN